MEYWQVNFPLPGRMGRMAKRAEDAGWDGLAFADRQCITGDVYVGVALAAEATSRIQRVNPSISTGIDIAGLLSLGLLDRRTRITLTSKN
jgi:hypothetical protein